MIEFFVLSMSHNEGYQPKNVFVNLATLMMYWGDKLKDHSKIQGMEITQQHVSTGDLKDEEIDQVFEVEILQNDDRWVRHYFATIEDIAAWKSFQMENDNIYKLDFANMQVNTLYLNRD